MYTSLASCLCFKTKDFSLECEAKDVYSIVIQIWAPFMQRNEGVVSKETVVLRRWGSSIQKFGFINRVDNKHLMNGPKGNSEFCFPETSMFPEAKPRETLRLEGKQNSLFPLGPVIKCLMMLYC